MMIIKKPYLIPCTSVVRVEVRPLLTGSALDDKDNNPSVEVSDEEYDGTFSSRKHGNSHNVWDEEEEEEENYNGW